MNITQKRLKKLGFLKVDRGICEIPQIMWVKDDVEIWNLNGEYWIVDALDQGGINFEYRTLEQLNRFFLAVGRELELSRCN